MTRSPIVTILCGASLWFTVAFAASKKRVVVTEMQNQLWAKKQTAITCIPNQVIGSSGKIKYEIKDGQPVLTKLPEINFIDDKEGKPVGIHQYIGKRPVFTAGNSDGDYAMLQYTTAGSGPRFGMIVHHTDAVREWAYDRQSHIGNLQKGLDDAAKYKWQIVDMKTDWKKIYPY